MAEWISVDRKLPDEDKISFFKSTDENGEETVVERKWSGWLFVSFDELDVRPSHRRSNVGYLQNGVFHVCYPGEVKVTHWMSPPDPPTEET